MPANVGDVAPDFSLPDQTGEHVSLSKFSGEKLVVLAFHVFDFTGGWTNQVSSFSRATTQFEKSNAQVLGISCDSQHSHRAWSNSLGNIQYPLLADFNPHGDMAKRYGLFNEANGAPKRAIVIVDKSGIIKFREEYPPGVLPSPEDILSELIRIG